ncbi:MAG: NHL repeat-containing protein, partial [Flavobacteriaceae bacterium]|nr:NHL repeat-containing protein [Flavobacteriaceae bacterium]
MALVLGSILFSCEEKEKTWQLTNTIQLEGINPIGISSLENNIWLSDGDHNRVVKIDSLGRILSSIDSLERPMHIDGTGTTLFIPQYGNDLILKWSNGKSNPLILSDSLDAPAGVSVYGDEIAIADFYNNRILYSSNGKDWKSFGEEGKANGQFYYPTDVQITPEKIWVADAYNNRVQVFDKDFKFLAAIG